MAKVTYLIQSDKPDSPIYLRLTDGRIVDVKRKTRETINSVNWNRKNGLPVIRRSLNAVEEQKQTDLLNTLEELQDFVLTQYKNRKDDDIQDGKFGDWLSEIINAHYNGGRIIEQLDYLLNYLRHYQSNVLPYRQTTKGIRIAKRTMQKQLTVIGYLNEFIKSENAKMKVSDYGKSMSNKFEQFLRNKKSLSENTVGKYIKYAKTIVNDAVNENIKVNPQLKDVKGFTVETPTVFLESYELDTIKKLNVLTEFLQISRDWLIIGCHTGQRASDLFRMSEKMFVNIDGNDFLNLTQMKTKNPVLIPVHDEVKNILAKRNGKFPPVFSDNMESNKTIFNKGLKKIAEIAGLDRMEKGRVYDREKKIYIHGEYPLHQIISSHVCRRTFATTYYGKIPNQIIMSVTGHKTEREFLQYIGIDNSELSKQMVQYWNDLKNKETETESLKKEIS